MKKVFYTPYPAWRPSATSCLPCVLVVWRVVGGTGGNTPPQAARDTDRHHMPPRGHQGVLGGASIEPSRGSEIGGTCKLRYGIVNANPTLQVQCCDHPPQEKKSTAPRRHHDGQYQSFRFKYTKARGQEDLSSSLVAKIP